MGFPRYVFKRGTGKVVANGRVKAESALVTSEKDLADLGPGWCSSPTEALGEAPKAAPEPKPSSNVIDAAPTKKVEVIVPPAAFPDEPTPVETPAPKRWKKKKAE